MPLSISQKSALDKLIAAGELDQAAAFLSELSGSGAAAPAPAAAPAKPAEPRDPLVVIFDLFGKVAALLGNHPDLAPLILELETVINPKPVPAPPSQ